jgi:hypothetical protein
MEHEIIQKKVKKGAMILRITAQVTLWVAIAAVGLIIIGGILMKVFPDIFARLLLGAGDGGSLNIGIIDYTPSHLSVSEIIRIQEFRLFSIAIGCVMGALFVHQLVGILREVENAKPFSPANAGRLGKMGILVIVTSVVYRIGQAAALSAMIDVAGLEDISVNYLPNTDMVFVGILLFILAGIFKYGSYLQDEYDATL